MTENKRDKSAMIVDIQMMHVLEKIKKGMTYYVSDKKAIPSLIYLL